MTKQIKIIAYAITDGGYGDVQKIGEYESIEDIRLIAGMFSKDVVIEYEYETKED